MGTSLPVCDYSFPGQTAGRIIHDRLARKLEGSAKEIVNTSSLDDTTKPENEFITRTKPGQCNNIHGVPRIHYLYFTYVFTHLYLTSM